MRRNRWKKGDWLCICDRCGFTYYASELRREWTGLMVCPDDYEERHPQDYLPSRPDQQAPPWTRPESPDTFVTEVVLGDRNPMTGEIVVGASNSLTNAANFQYSVANATNTSNIPYGFSQYNTISNIYVDFEYYDGFENLEGV